MSSQGYSRPKQDTYQAVTDRIIAALERGVVPWRRPWHSMNQGAARNVRNGRPYRGINVFLLALAALEGGYSDPRWGTYKAISEAGGQVRRGEHGTRVILWKAVKKTVEGSNGDPEERGYMLLREYTVFNVEQADGIEPLPEVELTEHERNERGEELIRGYVRDIDHVDNPGPPLTFGGDRAVYMIDRDIVRVPELGAFDGASEFYSTVFHELTHSTGHQKRLGRIEPALLGTDPYAKEELVAEMGAAMLAGLAGIDTTQENSAAYIGSWLRRLKDNRKLVVQAAAQAQKAADLICGATFEDGANADEEPALARVAA